MAWRASVVGLAGALAERFSASNEVCRRAARLSAPAAFGLAARKVEAPAEVLGSPYLGIDEAIDALMTDDGVTGIMCHAPDDLFG